MSKTWKTSRATDETKIEVTLTINGSGIHHIDSPIDFFNHLLATFTRHGLFDLEISAAGDIHFDQHHLVEDTGILLGNAFKNQLMNNFIHNRAGFFVHPMDEALGIVAVDFAGRSYLQYEVEYKRRYCGELDLDLLPDFFQGFSQGSSSNVAVRGPFGRSDHHKAEAIFKAFGRAVRMACSSNERGIEIIQSIKGVLYDRNS